MKRDITYSPAYTLVPTYECFNRCSYCNFRIDPGKNQGMSREQAEEKLSKLKKSEVWEILILSGEVHPNSPERKSWFAKIYDFCALALGKGYLPHTNVGPLTRREMEQLKQVNVSMGLMLEQVTPFLAQGVHLYAPSKEIQLRKEQLELAGELKIPFTTGLLLGIGESQDDWWVTLETIAKIQQKWGHIQEVILQPYSPGEGESFSNSAFEINLMPELIEKASKILPPEITIQIPPNLIDDPQILLKCLEAGARDLGGIGPIDEVNPTYPHRCLSALSTLLECAGWRLLPRLPVYPQYYDWLPEHLSSSLQINNRKKSLKL